MIGAIAGCLLIVVLAAREVLRAGTDQSGDRRVRMLTFAAYPLLVVLAVALGVRLAGYL